MTKKQPQPSIRERIAEKASALTAVVSAVAVVAVSFVPGLQEQINKAVSDPQSVAPTPTPPPAPKPPSAPTPLPAPDFTP